MRSILYDWMIYTYTCTATSNRQCEDCAAGKYSNTNNAAACTTWDAACTSGQYQSTAPSSTTNRGCTACSAECSAGTYESQSCSSTSNQNRVCTACPGGTFNNANNAASCTTWSAACTSGQYQSTAPSSTTDRGCTACSAACIAGQYESTACSSTSNQNRICLTCNAGKYTTSGGLTSCTLCRTDCLAGTYQTKACTTTQNMECQPCPAGQWQDLAGQSACKTCAAGSFITNYGLYAFSGNYDNNMNAILTTIGPGYGDIAVTISRINVESGYDFIHYDFTKDSSGNNVWVGTYTGYATQYGNIQLRSSTGYIAFKLTSDYSNVLSGPLAFTYTSTLGPKNACLQCSAENYSASAGSTICSSCDAGKFTAQLGLTVCSNCGAGSFSGTTSSTVCTPCTAGKYSTATVNSLCTDCVAGKYSATASATLATVCLSCVGRFISASAGSTVCTSCGASTNNNDIPVASTDPPHTSEFQSTSSHPRWHTLFLSVIKKIISPIYMLHSSKQRSD
jgi:hypothetical protein